MALQPELQTWVKLSQIQLSSMTIYCLDIYLPHPSLKFNYSEKKHNRSHKRQMADQWLAIANS